MAEVVFEPAYVPDKFRQIQKKFADCVWQVVEEFETELTETQSEQLRVLYAMVIDDHNHGPKARPLVVGQQLRRDWTCHLYRMRLCDGAQAALKQAMCEFTLDDVQELARRANLLDGRLMRITYDGKLLILVTVVRGLVGTPIPIEELTGSDAAEPLGLIAERVLGGPPIGVPVFDMFMDTTPRTGGKLN